MPSSDVPGTETAAISARACLTEPNIPNARGACASNTPDVSAQKIGPQGLPTIRDGRVPSQIDDMCSFWTTLSSSRGREATTL